MAIGERQHRRPDECATDGATRRASLRLENGRVVGDERLDEIVGYAREARTTGGLGGMLVRVTSSGDWSPQAREAPIAGSVRAAIEAVTSSRQPGWIVFDLPPASRIVLKAPLRLPDNVTLDGDCADVTLEAPSTIGLLYVTERSNVVIRGLSFRKTDEIASRSDRDDKDCITIDGRVDRVAVVHNDFAACGDGVIDITVSPGKPYPEQGRLTVAFNRFRDHDKVMLFGTFTCETGTADYAAGCPRDGRAGAPPALFLTLLGNVFSGTGQRHPRVFGRVMAHISDNVIIFAPVRRSDGRPGASYGVLVTNGARALVERNIFVGDNSTEAAPTPFAVWTTTTPGASRLPSDHPGSIRVRDNAVIGKAVIDQRAAGDVEQPSYTLATTDSPASPGQVAATVRIACIAARAGRNGLRAAARCDGDDDLSGSGAGTAGRTQSGVPASRTQTQGEAR